MKLKSQKKKKNTLLHSIFSGAFEIISLTLLVFIPGSDYSGAFRSEEDLKAMDDDIRKW